MDEEFFKDLGYEGVETEEQLKDLVKADLEAKQEYEIENKYVDDLLEEAAKHTVVDLPEELVHEEIHRMMHQYEENLKTRWSSMTTPWTRSTMSWRPWTRMWTTS